MRSILAYPALPASCRARLSSAGCAPRG